MAVDLSTIGVKFGWAVETAAGTKPTKFTQIPNCKSIAGISLDQDSLETTPLEVGTKTYIAGLKDPAGGSSWNLTFNMNDDLITNWTKLKTAYETAKKSSLSTWGVIYVPGMADSCFIKFEPGDIPLNEIGVGDVLEVEIANTIDEYVGWETAVEPTTAAE